MKAMILAAGRGTRLLPYTQHTPKPLFTLNGRPMLELTLAKLQQAGCRAVIINTHHLHERIEAWVQGWRGAMAVHTCHEPELLGTGGALRNVRSFWAGGPLLVVNADIVSDIDLAALYRFHEGHAWPVTMAMHTHTDFNTVRVDADAFVVGFGAGTQAQPGDSRSMAFTGIHVLDPRVLDFLPSSGPAHIIDAYEKLLESGARIKAYIVRDPCWQDIGTPSAYQSAAFDHMAPGAFARAFGSPPRSPIQRKRLQGDGSDRRWYRALTEGRSLIVADHGIRSQHGGRQEVDAFVDIGRHLHARNVPVPRIYLHDAFAGLVFLEDLGDLHLTDAVAGQSEDQQRRLYCRVIDQWLNMALAGARGFDVGWTYQSSEYDRRLILDRECRYFVEAFLNGYLRRTERYADLADEFEHLAEGALVNGCNGFLHRDLQSRNIMLENGNIRFIDFQGGRLGPLQYDLASLLIDPYTALSAPAQTYLRDYATRALYDRSGESIERFARGYDYCAVTRNLQILGAFGYLSRVKGKTGFEAFIPTALKTLRRHLAALPDAPVPKLTALVARINT
jgi:NDP-sugar pyrophosphorylase family protein